MTSSITSLFAAVVTYWLALLIAGRMLRMPIHWSRALAFSGIALPIGLAVAYCILTLQIGGDFLPFVVLVSIQMLLGFCFLGRRTLTESGMPVRDGTGAAAAGIAAFIVGLVGLVAFLVYVFTAPPGTIHLLG
jgi:hypothetical protein